MGVSKFDKSAAHKRYETRYAGLTTGKQVRLLLRDIHALRIRAEQGDFAAVDVLADLTTAVTRAGLTARQWEAVENVYLKTPIQIRLQWLVMRNYGAMIRLNAFILRSATRRR